MLVEDDNNLREIYGARLQAEGHEIVAAKDGEEALALAVKEKPELIISDVMMPRISGFDMLDILRNAPETKNTKVIMMTALSQAEDKARADKLGADRYLVKSQVTLEDVAKVVRDVLEGNDGGVETKLEDIPSGPQSQGDQGTASSTNASIPVVPATEDPIAQTPADDSSSLPAEEPSATPSSSLSGAVQPASDTSKPAPADSTEPSQSLEPALPSADPTLPQLDEEAPEDTSDAPQITPLKTPELAAAEELLNTSPETAPSAAPEETPSAPQVVLPTPPDEVVPEPTAVEPESIAPEPEPIAASPIGPSLEEALADEETSSSKNEQSTIASSAPTIINGLEQPGIIAPAPQESQPAEPESASPVAEQNKSEVHAQPPTPLQVENALHGKTLTPLNDPTKKIDIDALLKAEEAKAGVINPTAGTNITPIAPGTPLSETPKATAEHDEIAL